MLHHATINISTSQYISDDHAYDKIQQRISNITTLRVSDIYGRYTRLAQIHLQNYIISAFFLRFLVWWLASLSATRRRSPCLKEMDVKATGTFVCPTVQSCTPIYIRTHSMSSRIPSLSFSHDRPVAACLTCSLRERLFCHSVHAWLLPYSPTLWCDWQLKGQRSMIRRGRQLGFTLPGARA